MPTSVAGLIRRALAFSLVVAPALFLVDNLIHPKEYERGNQAQQLEAIADAYGRWQLAHVLALLSVVVFVGVVVGLAFVAARRDPRLAVGAGALALAGLVGFGSVVAIDGFAWGILGEVSTKGDAATAATALEDMQESEWSLPYYLLPLGFVFGLVGLMYSAHSQGVFPTWAVALFMLGVLMVATETLLISNAYFIAGATVLFAGGAALALYVSRMTDAEFAAAPS